MCCGNSRQQWYATEPTRHAARVAGGVARGPRKRQTAVYMEYTGQTALTAIGGRSGRRYRFEGTGALVAVDPSDRPSLLAVPHLRQAASPW